MFSTSKNIIKNLLIKIRNYSEHFTTLDEAVAKLKRAKSNHKAAKTIFVQLRKKFLERYVARQSKDYKVTPEVITKLLQI